MNTGELQVNEKELQVNEKVSSSSTDHNTSKPSSPSELALREEHGGMFSLIAGHRLQELQGKIQYSEAN